MDLEDYRKAYHSQRSHAKARGIEFRLTFQEWCNFWGDDVDRRGRGPNDLQMQRFADTGPYEIGNIRKGTPAQNSATAANMGRKRACEAAHAELQEALDHMMESDSMPDHDEDESEMAHELGIRTSRASRYHFSG